MTECASLSLSDERLKMPPERVGVCIYRRSSMVVWGVGFVQSLYHQPRPSKSGFYRMASKNR